MGGGTENVLTPLRALVAELVRRYWVLGTDCSILEIQKLAWFLERTAERMGLDPLGLHFVPHAYGPYADRLRHLLDALDGSYLHCERRLADARPTDSIWFDQAKKGRVALYLRSDPQGQRCQAALQATEEIIDGFQSPHGLELLATVDWLLAREDREPTVASVREGLRHWPGSRRVAERKLRMFDDHQLQLALDRLASSA